MKTNHIIKLVERITRKSQPTNDTLDFYGHRVTLESGMDEYVHVLLNKTTDPYSEELASFCFDFFTKELYIEYAESDEISSSIARAFKRIYGYITIIKEEYECF